MPRPQLGPVLSVVRAAAYKQRILTHAEVVAALATPERGVALLPARPVEPRIVDPSYQASRERTLRRWGRG